MNQSFGQYLQAALLQELKGAKLWSGVSPLVVSGKLVENDIDISGFSKGDGTIAVEFTITNNDKVVFNKLVSAKHEWESSFIGAIAIPNGQANYPILIQTLFKTLFTDKAFLDAAKLAD